MKAASTRKVWGRIRLPTADAKLSKSRFNEAEMSFDRRSVDETCFSRANCARFRRHEIIGFVIFYCIAPATHRICGMNLRLWAQGAPDRLGGSRHASRFQGKRERAIGVRVFGACSAQSRGRVVGQIGRLEVGISFLLFLFFGGSVYETRVELGLGLHSG